MNPPQSEKILYTFRWNTRRFPEYYITGQHVSLERLRENPTEKMEPYISKKIPPYPRPLEFWVSDVTHVTEEAQFDSILKSEEFRPPECDLSWWDLKMTKDEIISAEKRYVESAFPTAQEVMFERKPFLEKFTTSPLFRPEKSRYGNYRFTFPLTELIILYKEQNCGGKEPVLRMHETITYKQQIVYTVLIHSPEDNEEFGKYPLLEESDMVCYKDGRIIWKAQAVCETHKYQFVSGEVQAIKHDLYYVWDLISFVFHMPKRAEPHKALKIPRRRLIEALEACEYDIIKKPRDPLTHEERRKVEERNSKAIEKVSELKRELEEDEKEKDSKEGDDIKKEEDS